MIADTLDIGLALAEHLGWAVFPVSSQKTPGKGSHGYLDASADPGVIRNLWRRWPFPLIGIATGATSGIDVLDIDVKHASACRWWRRNCDRIPATRTYRTRGGGLHCYFVHADGVRCSNGRIAKGIDIKADGGSVIHWFAAGFDCLDQIEPAALPSWLYALALPPPLPPPPDPVTIRAPDKLIQARIDGVIRAVATAREGQRNATLYWSACRIAELASEGAIPRQEAAGALLAAAVAIGLPAIEAQRTIASGIQGTVR
jgi:hypothetical protein